MTAPSPVRNPIKYRILVFTSLLSIINDVADGGPKNRAAQRYVHTWWAEHGKGPATVDLERARRSVRRLISTTPVAEKRI